MYVNNNMSAQRTAVGYDSLKHFLLARAGNTCAMCLLTGQEDTVKIDYNLNIVICFFSYRFMPSLYLRRTKELFVAQGPEVMLYYNIKRNGPISLWQQQMIFKGHKCDVNHFVCRGDQLISCGEDKTLRTWFMPTGYCDGIYAGHSGSIHGVDGYGDIMVSGGRDKTIKVRKLSLLGLGLDTENFDYDLGSSLPSRVDDNFNLKKSLKSYR
ncbi:Lissencephaly-1-like [Exaiptasia diaphana]|nr:Lissencephaly-1-like [Exaiptasia diaphana]